MKAELPVGNDVGGAFWLLPQDGAWPPEIDVEENLGQDPGTVYQTLHDGTPGNVSNLQIPVSVPSGNIAAGYHTYGVDSEADTTTFYLDGKATGRFATPAGLHKPMYTILQDNTAGCNPNWGKPVDGSTPFPADFKVDYVRAYASKPDLCSGGSPDPGGAAASPASPPVLPPLAPGGTGANTLVLNLSEDAYQGDAQFSVTVDGVTLGGPQFVTALHGAGAAQDIGFNVAMAAGTHDVAVSFLNDAWGGTSDMDRNLYVNTITANSTAMPGTAATLFTSGAQHFFIIVGNA